MREGGVKNRGGERSRGAQLPAGEGTDLGAGRGALVGMTFQARLQEGCAGGDEFPGEETATSTTGAHGTSVEEQDRREEARRAGRDVLGGKKRMAGRNCVVSFILPSCFRTAEAICARAPACDVCLCARNLHALARCVIFLRACARVRLRAA